MFKSFKEHVLVHEVVIPPKRERTGRRYGFVRFHKVCDENILGIQLDNFFINLKIHTNIPKFQRSEQKNERVRSNESPIRSRVGVKRQFNMDGARGKKPKGLCQPNLFLKWLEDWSRRVVTTGTYCIRKKDRDIWVMLM